MSAVISVRELIDAGVHFGHQTRRWNPKMKRFIHGEQNGIYIIDLRKTMAGIEAAYTYVRDLVAGGGTILFIGTKRQAQDSVQGYAEKCGMPYVNQRWLGGMLTNFETISKRVGKMKEYARMRDSGEFEMMPKKEALLLSRELVKLERNLGGMRHLTKVPDAVFIMDTKKEDIAVTEANKLRLPIVAVVDTNCDPDLAQYVIPGNDDAIRAGDLMARVICDAVQEGHQIRAAKTGVPTNKPRTAEEDAAKAVEQAEARRVATEQAREREARVAATTTPAPGAPQVAPASEAPLDAAPPAEASEKATASEPPTTEPPTTEPPTTEPPTSEAPTTESPIAEAPATDEPTPGAAT